MGTNAPPQIAQRFKSLSRKISASGETTYSRPRKKPSEGRYRCLHRQKQCSCRPHSNSTPDVLSWTPVSSARCHVVKGTVRSTFRWRQVFIGAISHTFPPFCFPLPFSLKRLPAPFLRRISALACSPQSQDILSRSPAPCGASPAGVSLFGRSFCFQGAVHR